MKSKPDRLPRRDPDSTPDGDACPECYRRQGGHSLDCSRRHEPPEAAEPDPAWKLDPMLQVTESFQAWELWRSDTAARLGIDNTPGPHEFAAACCLARDVLQPMRDEFGPFTPDSVYRCQALDRALKGEEAGWVSKSQHVLGEASDSRIVGVDLLDIARWIIAEIDFDQLILEYYDPRNNAGWVHVSRKPDGGNRGEVLRAFRMAGRTMYERGLP